MKDMAVCIGMLLGGCFIGTTAGAQMEVAPNPTESDRGVIVTAPPIELYPNTGRYALNVEIRQIKHPEENAPVTGVVEIRSLVTDDVIKIGNFSIFPATDDPKTVHSFNFDLSAKKDAVDALGPGYEVEVVSVNALTGLPTSQASYEIVGATLKSVQTK
jgi:hypothetical protein